ncbi:MAG TPA: MXAN_6577-like cysteine-rich protein [Kofleriaceae bacterium]|nr:MXAN_6577-like cysteine-rich protein [Kofleriaceae bacterium]
MQHSVVQSTTSRLRLGARAAGLAVLALLAVACGSDDPPCPGSQTLCGDVCVDLASDRANCGACGTTCLAGEVCSGAGACELSCQAGLTACDGTCTNTDSDRANCGACGHACDDGEVCNGSGQCELSCQAGLTACDGTCTDTDTDRANCGACGHACGDGEVCDGNGQCDLVCPPGLTECDGACVDTDHDLDNCGACGTTCGTGEVCSGECLGQPVAYTISPDLGPTTGNTPVVITGENFDAMRGMAVSVGPFPVHVTSVTRTEIHAIMPANSAGPWRITVQDMIGRVSAFPLTYQYRYAQVSFANGVDYPTGLEPRGQVLADLNEDGVLDVATACRNTSANPTAFLYTSLGNGDGTFAPAVANTVDQRVSTIVAADFNRDQHLDLATMSGVGELDILHGRGDGTFDPWTSADPTETRALAGGLRTGLGDLDHDGDPDVLIGYRDAQQGVGALLGNGDSTFAATPIQTTTSVPLVVIAADLNNDGKQDVIASQDGGILIYRGNGNGTLQAPTSINLGIGTTHPSAIVVGNFNNDTWLDLAVSTGGATSSAMVLVNQGNGVFGAPVNLFANAGQVSGLAAGDLDRDRNLDLVVTNRDTSTYSVFLGNGNGTFGAPTSHGTGLQATQVDLADLDDDGAPDIVIQREAGFFTVHRNTSH